MRVLDLFSGIGGFSLGLEMAGDFETVGFVEQDEKCQAVLRKHWPDVPIFGDIREFSGDECGSVDVVCGGFPCQPFSVAGKQRGTKDDRHLWPEMLRVIREARPAWVVGENVAGIVRMELDTVLSDLEASGYTVGAYIIPACAVDAPHRRDRVWIVGNGNGHGESISAQHGETSGLSGVVADAYGEGSQKRPKLPRVEKRETEGHKRQNTSICCRWNSEPAVGRVVDGIPGRVDRLKQLGNAVVPQVVAQIGRAILEVQQ